MKKANSFSIASIDRYRKKKGERKDLLDNLFESHGISFHKGAPKMEESHPDLPRTYRSFGYTEKG